MTFEVERTSTLYSDEEWRPVENNPGYLVSNLGRVKSPKGKYLNGTVNKGYIRITLPNGGPTALHRIVMIAFKPINNPENYSVDHINGIRNDNRLENLRWVW